MTLDQALTELGIDRDAGADQARRAYLKLLKLRKPESDPQGFMRLREAYELAKERLGARDELFRAIALANAGAAPASELFDDGAASDPKPHEPASDVHAPIEPVEEASEPSAGDADLPLPDAGEPAARAEAPAPETAEAAPAPEPFEPFDVELFDVLLRVGEHVQAAEQLSRFLDGAALHAEPQPLPLAKALQLLLALHGQGAVAPALALHGSLARWLTASGQEARLLRGEAAARWSLLGELAALGGGFPQPARRAIAEAMLAGNLGEAKKDFITIHAMQPAVARGAARELRSKAPILAAALADALDPPLLTRSAPAQPSPQRSSRGGYWAIATVIIAVLRLMAYGLRSTPTYHDNPSIDPSRWGSHLTDDAPSSTAPRGYAPRRATTPEARKDRVLERVESTRIHAWYMMGLDAGRQRIDYTKVTADVDTVASAVERGDCKAARGAMAKLSARTRAAAEDEAGRREVEGLASALDSFCGAPGKGTSDEGAAAGERPAGLDAGRRRGTERP